MALLTGEVLSEHEEHAVLLRVVQPALAGLMDGSVSTLAPLFATAFATQNPHTTLIVGMAAAVGAGISMGFSEGLSDTGELTGRGHPFRRGAITGLATFLGGILHTLPFLSRDYWTAIVFASAVVGVELLAIAWIRNRFFGTPLGRSVLHVVVGGLLVFAAGVLLGSEA
ncbi:MAG TPA: VIT1/CCC1 transporter family protein [Chloroflexota bacterium]|jgi:VIT1/CCC1 family predicted Fe2+/Mn2+ transporter